MAQFYIPFFFFVTFENVIVKFCVSTKCKKIPILYIEFFLYGNCEKVHSSVKINRIRCLKVAMKIVEMRGCTFRATVQATSRLDLRFRE